MNALLALSRWIDGLSTKVGRIVYWLVLVVSLISAFNAAMRFTIDYSSNAWLEIQWYLFSGIFLLGGGYTLLRNEHVRIDVVSAHLSPRTRAWIDIFGLLLFVMPLCVMLVVLGVPYAKFSYVVGEVSSNAGGLIRWPAKALIPLGFALLGLQALSELIKRVAYLAGRIDDPNERKGHSAEEELALEMAAQHGEVKR
jgi:TRAP-type mannitol/chloroaromatic compound transport system permease small subunit